MRNFADRAGSRSRQNRLYRLPYRPRFSHQQAHALATTPPPHQISCKPAGGSFHFDSDGRGQGRGYTWAIEHQGAFALAVVNLQSEQAICAEAGAMVSMSANVDLHSELKGGVFGALKRAVGGESAFVSTFTSKGWSRRSDFCTRSSGRCRGNRNTESSVLCPVQFLFGRRCFAGDRYKIWRGQIIFWRRGIISFCMFPAPVCFSFRHLGRSIERFFVRASNMSSIPGTLLPGKHKCNTTCVRRQRAAISAVSLAVREWSQNSPAPARY